MFFLVSAKCGHVGRGLYVEKLFPIMAETKSEAAQKVRRFPRVKKHLRDAITNVVECQYSDYKFHMQTNSLDPYLKAKCNRDVCNEKMNIQIIESGLIKSHCDFISREQRIRFRQKKIQQKERSLYEYES